MATKKAFMPNLEIEEFAKRLVQNVRDRAVRSSDGRLRAGANHALAKRWRQAASGGSDLQAIGAVLAPDIVDDTIFYLLHAIDDGSIQLSFTSSTGKTVSLPDDGLGELAGWYMGSGGWRAMYSRERFVDDFSDLK